MVLFTLYLIACFLAGLLSAPRHRRGWMLLLLGGCVVVAAAFYWVDALRMFRASPPPEALGEWAEKASFAVSPPGTTPAAARGVLTPASIDWRGVGHAVLVLVSWAVFVFTAVLMAVRPPWGLQLLLFLTLVADPIIAPWYPMNEGFSARQTIFFVADWFVISPFEVCVLVAFTRWAVDALRHGGIGIERSGLLFTAIAFGVCAAAGLVRGLVAGGDFNVALWELRALSYVIALVLLVSRYIRSKAEIVGLIGAAMLAIGVEAVAISIEYFSQIRGRTEGFRALSDHATSLHGNTIFVLLAAAWIYRSSPVLRFGLLPMVAPVAVCYIVNQRRAAMFGLMIAIALLLPVGLRLNPRLIRRVLPVAAMAAAVWLALGWNDSGPMGLPARAMKAVFNSQQRSAWDQSSDYYRVLEDRNIIATIRQDPLKGVGFGRPFELVVPLPSIANTFVWWRYITHNAILWVWMKTGVVGFVTLLLLLGAAIQTGSHIGMRQGDRDLGAIAVLAALFVVMFAIYAFVDMAWDARSAIYLGAMIGVINSMDTMRACYRERHPEAP